MNRVVILIKLLLLIPVLLFTLLVSLFVNDQTETWK
jgi:nitrogen fixation/metabolism regulation signal transduction histidine kinase